MEKLGTQSGERVWPAGWGPPPTSANGSASNPNGGHSPGTSVEPTPQQVAVAEAIAEAKAAPRRTRADEAKQREAIKAKIDGSQPPPDRAAAAKSLFSPAVQAQMEAPPIELPTQRHLVPTITTGDTLPPAALSEVGNGRPIPVRAEVDISPPTAPEIDYDKLAAAIVRNVTARLLA
jgi:hypothetical protein